MHVDYARFDQRAPIGNVNFEDLVEARSRNQQRIRFGQGAARQTSSRPARHDGNAVLVGPLDGGGDLFC